MRPVKAKIGNASDLNYGFPKDCPSGTVGTSRGNVHNFGQCVSKKVGGFMSKDENFPEKTCDGYDLDILSLNNF